MVLSGNANLAGLLDPFDRFFEADAMLPDRSETGVRNYLRQGEAAHAIVDRHLRLLGSPAPKRILDLPCGAGRVTRWFRKHYPNATIFATDLSLEEIRFCVDTFSCVAVNPALHIEDYELPENLDAIWCGSLLTHLSEVRSSQLLEQFASSLAPGGIMVVTTHGRARIDQLYRGSAAGIPDQLLERVKEGYYRHGYGYADYQPSSSYGFSLTSMAWICRWIEARDDVRLMGLHEGGWANRQDVIVIRKT